MDGDLNGQRLGVAVGWVVGITDAANSSFHFLVFEACPPISSSGLSPNNAPVPDSVCFGAFWISEL
jgi:hypothetical protein